jgi:hypothetical protein
MPTKNNLARPGWRRSGLYWTLILVLGSAAVAASSWPCLLGRGCTGADGRGFWLGFVSVMAMLVALAYSLRKDRPRMGFALEQWLYAHVIVGTLALELAVAHSGYYLEDVVAALALLFLFLTVTSGVAGLFLLYFLPLSQARTEAAVLLPDDLCQRLIRLNEEISELCGSAGGTLLTVYNELVIPLYRTPAGTEPPNADVSPWAERVAPAEQEKFVILAAKVEEVHDVLHLLGHHLRFQWWIRGWLLLHVPATIGLVVFTVAHILAMTWYGAP